ncbi:unnamed protein product [Chondrus crispus]|uniref:Uncharacterized protein n=1 Tax=Chondrus crispus TaxID=2769 RepID=R7QLD2_CHOCR|nr:unnamed protein product [Chondrus crispus]CDF39322.1 unnamed protein product [Chondrus crispus]|eukprot:XP_005719233.1 unnamed protein product [Chondrus crispus]
MPLDEGTAELYLEILLSVLPDKIVLVSQVLSKCDSRFTRSLQGNLIPEAPGDAILQTLRTSNAPNEFRKSISFKYFLGGLGCPRTRFFFPNEENLFPLQSVAMLRASPKLCAVQHQSAREMRIGAKQL